MSQHRLDGRPEEEALWFRRRGFVQAAAAWVSMGGWMGAVAQQRTNIVVTSGDILVNGAALARDQAIRPGDRVETGPGSGATFVVGNAAFQVRANSRVAVEGPAGSSTVSTLRMATGAVASVFGKGNSRQIVTPTLTAGIRGTGVYTEVFAERDNRSYFCNCYGVVDVSSRGEAVVSESVYHQAFWGEPEARNGRLLTPAPAINHTDEELEALAMLIEQRTAWQIAGRKGTKDGMGYLEPPAGGATHPAAPR